MKASHFLACVFALVGADRAHAEHIWDVADPHSSCSYSQTLGSSGNCASFHVRKIYSSPLLAYGKELPVYFDYALSLNFNFTCKREVGTSPLFAELVLTDSSSNNILSRLRISPTNSPETRKITAKIKTNQLSAEIYIQPSQNSTFYGSCFFELREVEMLPDLEAIAYHADMLIDRHDFANSIDKVLSEALTKPNGWERAEQLATDLDGYADQKLSECKRNIRQLSRKLKISPVSLLPQDDLDITDLSGFDSRSLSFSWEQLNDTEAVCSGMVGLAIAGKIGASIADYMHLKDVENKAQIFASLDECRSQISEICRNTVQVFREETLQAYRSSSEELEKIFLDYLEEESNRLNDLQSDLQERIESIIDEIRNT